MAVWETVHTALGTIRRAVGVAVGDTCAECWSDTDVNPLTGTCSRCEIEADVEQRRYNYRT